MACIKNSKSTEPIFLDQELRAVVQDAELGKRFIDKLVSVQHVLKAIEAFKRSGRGFKPRPASEGDLFNKSPLTPLFQRGRGLNNYA